MSDFYLLDIERTIAFNRPFYWKGNRCGYTPELEFAGLFHKQVAETIVKNDLDNKTVMISQDMIFQILGGEMKRHEGDTAD
jgi:hypothetical protein